MAQHRIPDYLEGGGDRGKEIEEVEEEKDKDTVKCKDEDEN